MKKFIVESWFKIEDSFETIEEARRYAEDRKAHERYKDVFIIELEEKTKTVV